jgi:hypothetical protein
MKRHIRNRVIGLAAGTVAFGVISAVIGKEKETILSSLELSRLAIWQTVVVHAPES